MVVDEVGEVVVVDEVGEEVVVDEEERSSLLVLPAEAAGEGGRGVPHAAPMGQQHACHRCERAEATEASRPAEGES